MRPTVHSPIGFVRPRDVGLAVLVAALWGLAFVATRVGLDSFSPPQLTVLRFAIAALPAVVLPRPPVGWAVLVPLGLTLFAGQFLLQFFGIASGMPPGLAAVVVQTQALFTIVLAAAVLRETPTRRQALGTAVALAGLAAIALTVGGDLTRAGVGLTVGSAVSWAIGNVLLKRHARDAPMLPLMVWLSVVPPLPAALVALLVDGPSSLTALPGRASWLGVGAAVYLGAGATVLAYAIWGSLLRRYPAAAITPFALLAPFVAASASAVVFGETFGPLRLAGMALVLLGLAIIVLSPSRAVDGPRCRHA